MLLRARGRTSLGEGSGGEALAGGSATGHRPFRLALSDENAPLNNTFGRLHASLHLSIAYPENPSSSIHFLLIPLSPRLAALLQTPLFLLVVVAGDCRRASSFGGPSGCRRAPAARASSVFFAASPAIAITTITTPSRLHSWSRLDLSFHSNHAFFGW